MKNKFLFSSFYRNAQSKNVQTAKTQGSHFTGWKSNRRWQGGASGSAAFRRKWKLSQAISRKNGFLVAMASLPGPSNARVDPRKVAAHHIAACFLHIPAAAVIAGHSDIRQEPKKPLLPGTADDRLPVMFRHLLCKHHIFRILLAVDFKHLVLVRINHHQKYAVLKYFRRQALDLPILTGHCYFYGKRPFIFILPAFLYHGRFHSAHFSFPIARQRQFLYTFQPESRIRPAINQRRSDPIEIHRLSQKLKLEFMV